MTPEEYAARQAVISAGVAALAFRFGRFWVAPALSVVDWLGLLRFLWPEVQVRREESAALARVFYDSQRSAAFPSLPRNDVPLEGNDFEVFVQSMEPVRKRMSQAESPRDAVTMLSLQVVREVENAGRRQIIRAVKEDEFLAEVLAAEPKPEPKRLEVSPSAVPPGRRTIPFSDDELSSLRKLAGLEPESRQTWGGQVVEEYKNLRETKRELAQEGRSDLVRGWARVATGDETCGWCLMLISRGPVYYGADTAGLDLDDESAMEKIAAGEDVSDYMEEWHTGCDCKVIPVFKKDDWENSPYGRAAARALELWEDASKEADRLIEERGVRIHTTGKKKGEEFTKNEEAILALRRRLYSGDINPSEYAGLAA